MMSPTPTPVTSKFDFYVRSMTGEFGPSPKILGIFDSAQSAYPVLRSSLGAYDFVTLRRATGQGGQFVARSLWKDALSQWRGGDMVVQCPVPAHERIKWQGEVTCLNGILHLTSTDVKLPLRHALEESSHDFKGVYALDMMRRRVRDDQIEQIMHLLHQYPDHVIEFSTFADVFASEVGESDLAIWEVRLY